ncbi:hypothetical protein QCD85_14740 [Paenibacillus sp. PsM32]|uniref:Uncharacterized protein n=1 Tax=Paenibacillus kyungheensis TaxID=1452732 RepID=A0AAX3M2H8_9BACL|nr:MULTISPECIES: hypothetical protein [Paenibacillus]MDN4619362.1 hypothetical protein [Paenibacillus sp. PsM32]MDQ1237099.1 repressor of nif and glnA expression [Paenibacillus sp. SORGH_AS_0306]MDR6109458.1 repressor of nif and glnA expression [Paenibacillus sp. SORGH_AS_0338]WCT56465.1 hypothetical protein PQ456_02710 [Paenibacillus kyungheensis]WDF50422.1 hypothetical protein PQ460_21015 [Paenibacillus sp. KACC 21273]
MHAEVQNLFIRIHLLHHSNEEKLTVNDMQPFLEDRGYRVGEREIKQELEYLVQENMLTSSSDEYIITGTGIQELKAIRKRLSLLCGEVVPGSSKQSSSRKSYKEPSVVM